MDPTPLQRALSAAPEKPSTTETRVERELFCFGIGTLKLAFPAVHVREVVRLAPMTPLPRTPAFLMGVCGHRGEVLPVVDLLRFLSRGELKPGPRSRLLVGISGNQVVAFLADQIMGLQRVRAEEILPAPLGGDATSEYVDGIVPRPDGALHVVDVQRLLGALRQRAVAR